MTSAMHGKIELSLFPLIAFVTAMTIGICGCSKPNSSQLPGSYTCVYPYATEMLGLNPDGTYSQTITMNSGQVFSNTGKWIFHSRDGRLELEKPIIIDTGFGKPKTEVAPSTGDWFMGVSRDRHGKITLEFNPDLEFTFVQNK